jgi:hypothetical protein
MCIYSPSTIGSADGRRPIPARKILLRERTICKCYRSGVRSVAVAFAVSAGIAAGVAAGSAHAVSPPVIGMPVDSPSAGSPALTSADRSAAATVTVRAYPLLCGKPRGALVVAFPASVELPKAMPLGTVRVNGLAAAKVAVHGHDVTVTAPIPTSVTCQSIVLGRVTLSFVAGAGLRAAKHGSSAVAVHEGAHRYKATLTVTG